MSQQINVYFYDSYTNALNYVCNEINQHKNFNEDNILFCEDKRKNQITEYICMNIQGSINTEIYSFFTYFNNFCTNKNITTYFESILILYKLTNYKINLNHIKQILNIIHEFEKSNINLLNTKIKNAKKIITIYNKYKKFMLNNNLTDIGSFYNDVINYLTNMSLNDTNIYLFNITDLHQQILKLIELLIIKAKTINIIHICNNENDQIYQYTINTYKIIINKLQKCILNIYNNFETNNFNKEKEIIKNILFNSIYSIYNTTLNNVFLNKFNSQYEQIKFIANIIKNNNAENNCAIILNNNYESCINNIEHIFNKIGINYFYNFNIQNFKHPIITLLIDYINVYKSYFNITNILHFAKNQIFYNNQEDIENFENYILKHYNIDLCINIQNIKDIALYFTNNDTINNIIIQLYNIFNHNFDIEYLFEKININNNCKKYCIDNTSIIKNILNTIQLINKYIHLKNISYNELLNIIQYATQYMYLNNNKATTNSVVVYNSNINILNYDYIFFIDTEINTTKTYDILDYFTDEEIKELIKTQSINTQYYNFLETIHNQHFVQSLLTYNKQLFIIKTINDKNIQSICTLSSKLSTYINIKQYQPNATYFIEDATLNHNFDFIKEKNKSNLMLKLIKFNKKNYSNKILIKSNIINDYLTPTAIESYNICPFKSLLNLVLNIQERETTIINTKEIGILLHELIAESIKYFIENKYIICDLNINNIVERIINKPIYNNFFHTKENKFILNKIISNFKTNLQEIINDINICQFKPQYIEISNNNNNLFQPISINNKYNLNYKIDRIDINCVQNAIKLIDYKISIHNDTLKYNEIYYGLKMQMYLYSLSFLNNIYFSNKKVTTIEYVSLTNNIDKNANINKQTINDEKDIKKYTEYSYKLTNKILDYLSKNNKYILRSPINNVCNLCEYKILCCKELICKRNLKTITKQDIYNCE